MKAGRGESMTHDHEDPSSGERRRAVAEHLEVHVNTIRYRLHRAEDLLRVIPTSPKEQTALALAAFTWQRYHMAEQTSL